MEEDTQPNAVVINQSGKQYQIWLRAEFVRTDGSTRLYNHYNRHVATFHTKSAAEAYAESFGIGNIYADENTEEE